MSLCSRRHFMYTSSFGLAGLGLLDLMTAEADAASAPPPKPLLEPVHYDLSPKPTHHEPRAKAMISMFMTGGPSHIDLFDYKPELVRLDGQDFPGQIAFDNPAQASRLVRGPIWKFQQHGQCGMQLGELLPYLGSVADDITLIRSVRTNVNNHTSVLAMNSGSGMQGRPMLGSWLVYGLGSVTRELPSFVALTHPAGPPLFANDNWTNGWLPSIYQGTVVRPTEPRILNLDPPDYLAGKPQRGQLDLLRQLNNEHLTAHPGENDLAARIANYELAARMQLAAREAFDVSGETKETLELYGVHNEATRDYGMRCLIARRLVERGVRFVQIFASGQTWDHHSQISKELPLMCAAVDQPAAALVADLKRRGLLDTTLVHWGGEMGRLPTVQVPRGADVRGNTIGRDHNVLGFSMWTAGGGLKAGYTHGQTDEFGHHAVENVVTHSDWLATVLHLFGLDHKRLNFKRDVRETTLTDGQGSVVQSLLA